MPTGPKGQRRPADAIGNAIRVAQIATGEAEKDFGPEKPEPGRVHGHPQDHYREQAR